MSRFPSLESIPKIAIPQRNPFGRWSKSNRKRKPDSTKRDLVGKCPEASESIAFEFFITI